MKCTSTSNCRGSRPIIEHGIPRIGVRKACPFRCSAAPGVPALECPMVTKPFDLTRTTLAVLSIVGLIVVSFLVVRPFLAATVWAATLVVATWPFMRRLQSAFGGRRWAAVTLMTLLLLFLVLIPLSMAISSIATHASRLLDMPDAAAALLVCLHRRRGCPMFHWWVGPLPKNGRAWWKAARTTWFSWFVPMPSPSRNGFSRLPEASEGRCCTFS